MLRQVSLALLAVSLAAAKEPPAELAITVGQAAPEFTVSERGEKPLKLSDFRAKSHLVIVFGRAHWWPPCIAQLVQLQEKIAEFKSLDIEVLSIHREEKEGAAGLEKTARKTGAAFHLSADLGNEATAAWSPEGFDSYIIHKDGTVLAILEGIKFDRPTAEEIVAKAREVLRPSEK